jgi:hypothetical protein
LFGRWYDFDSLDAAATGIFSNLLHDDAFQLVCCFQLLLSHGLTKNGRQSIGKVARQLNRSAWCGSRLVQELALPTVSATCAPRLPSGLGEPVVAMRWPYRIAGPSQASHKRVPQLAQRL